MSALPSDSRLARCSSSFVPGERSTTIEQRRGRRRGGPDVLVRVGGWGAKKRIRRCLSLLAPCLPCADALRSSHHDDRMFSCFCLVRFFGFSVSCLLHPPGICRFSRREVRPTVSSFLSTSVPSPRSRVAPGSFYVRSEREGSRRLRPVSIDRERDQIARGIVKANDSTTSHQFHPHRSSNSSWRPLHSMLTAMQNIAAGTDWLLL